MTISIFIDSDGITNDILKRGRNYLVSWEVNNSNALDQEVQIASILTAKTDIEENDFFFPTAVFHLALDAGHICI